MIIILLITFLFIAAAIGYILGSRLSKPDKITVAVYDNYIVCAGQYKEDVSGAVTAFIDALPEKGMIRQDLFKLRYYRVNYYA